MALNVTSSVKKSTADELNLYDVDKCNKFLSRCVTPGSSISCEDDCMRGHGIVKQLDENETGNGSTNSAVYAAVAGQVERINKLVSVTPIRCAYVPSVGDVVVGRVVDIVAYAHRWLVDICATRHAVLHLASINLPGNEVRRRGREDASTMRSLLREGDLLIAEVHSINENGQPNLHTRSERYGRLNNLGRLLRVPVSLVKRTKAHFHTLPPGGIQMLIGTNGLIWLGAATSRLDLLIGPEPSSSSTGAFDGKLSMGDTLPYMGGEAYATIESDSYASGLNVDSAERLALNADVRETIARAAICIDQLARGGVALCDSTVLSALECSVRVGDGSVRQFSIDSRRADELVRLVRERLAVERAAADRIDSI